MRRGTKYYGREMRKFQLAGRRPRGRGKWRFMIEVKEDMKLFLSDEEDEEDRVRWRLMIGSGHLKG